MTLEPSMRLSRGETREGPKSSAACSSKIKVLVRKTKKNKAKLTSSRYPVCIRCVLCIRARIKASFRYRFFVLYKRYQGCAKDVRTHVHKL